MPKRKKRLRKGIESVGRQIESHRKRLKEAEKAGNIGLVNYYEKEIESLKSALAKKQDILSRK